MGRKQERTEPPSTQGCGPPLLRLVSAGAEEVEGEAEAAKVAGAVSHLF